MKFFHCSVLFLISLYFVHLYLIITNIHLQGNHEFLHFTPINWCDSSSLKLNVSLQSLVKSQTFVKLAHNLYKEKAKCSRHMLLTIQINRRTQDIIDPGAIRSRRWRYISFNRRNAAIASNLAVHKTFYISQRNIPEGEKCVCSYRCVFAARLNNPQI